jgi:hypothetical protein
LIANRTPRRRVSAIRHASSRVQRILVQPGRRPPARRSANISPSSWTIRASPRRSMPAWSRPRTARATTSSGPAATAIEPDQPRSPARERGFVVFMAAPPIRNMAIRMVGCQVLWLAHPDQILLPGLRWRSCRNSFAWGAAPARRKGSLTLARDGLPDLPRPGPTSGACAGREIPVCTENLSWRNDWAALFRSGRPGLAIQVEVTA